MGLIQLINGTLAQVPTSPTSIDAFGRQRFSQPVTIFDSKQIVDSQPLFWDDQQVSGSGTSTTYQANKACTMISVSNLTAGRRVRQTRRWFNYQPGKSQLIMMTSLFGSAATGITRRQGYYNDNNGLFLQQTSSGVSFGIRSFTSGSAVDTTYAQSTWSYDKLDGTGTSGYNLDMTKSQIMFIDFEWLAVGQVRFGFVIDGVPVLAHVVSNFNALTSTNIVYMSSPNLPLRYEIINDGTGPSATYYHICSTVASEGGKDDIGFPFSVSRSGVPLVTLNNSNTYPLIAIRLNSAFLHSAIKLLAFSVTCTSTAAFNYSLILNPTVTGTALSFTNVTNSSLDAQVDTTNATTVSGGTVLFSNAGQQATDSGVTGSLDTDFFLGSSIAGVSDILVLAVQRVTGTTETFYGSINWRDQQ